MFAHKNRRTKVWMNTSKITQYHGCIQRRVRSSLVASVPWSLSSRFSRTSGFCIDFLHESRYFLLPFAPYNSHYKGQLLGLERAVTASLSFMSSSCTGCHAYVNSVIKVCLELDWFFIQDSVAKSTNPGARQHKGRSSRSSSLVPLGIYTPQAASLYLP